MDVELRGRLYVRSVPKREAIQNRQWIRSDRGFDFVAPNGGVIFIHIQAAGFQPRTLLLNRRLGSAELYDEQSLPLRSPVRIELQPIRSEGESGPVGRAFSIDSSRGISFDTQLITSLPLPLFRNPDVLLGLAPGFAQPPLDTFATVGPSFAPGIGTAVSFAINGLRARDNDFTIDGSDYNDEEFGVRRQGFITPFPQSIDICIDYYQAVTANGDARDMVARWARGYKCTLESWRSKAALKCIRARQERRTRCQRLFPDEHSRLPRQVPAIDTCHHGWVAGR